jgi:hypothetical protein
MVETTRWHVALTFEGTISYNSAGALCKALKPYEPVILMEAGGELSNGTWTTKLEVELPSLHTFIAAQSMAWELVMGVMGDKAQTPIDCHVLHATRFWVQQMGEMPDQKFMGEH